MTVATEDSSIVFTGIVDGVALNVPFPIQASTEIKVRYGSADTLAVDGVDYTTALVPPDYLTATVTPMVGFAATSGGTVSVRREIPYTQPTDIPPSVTVASSRLEQMVDRVIFIAQQLRDALVYSLKFPTTDQAANISVLPTAAERAGKYLAFGPDGKPIASDANITGTPVTAYGASLAAAVNASGALTLLGFSTFFKTLIAAASLTALQTLLGMSTFFKTLLTAADAAAFRVLISVYSIAETAAAILLAAPYVKGPIGGWTYANNVGDATNDIDIAAGAGMDDTKTAWLIIGAMTKRSDAAWSAGNNGGGLDDIASAGNHTFYMHAISKADGSAPDYLMSLSATAPTMPATYTLKRLMGYFLRAGGTIVPFTMYEVDGGGIEHEWNTPTVEVAAVNGLTTARRVDALKVPLTFSVLAHVRALTFDAGASQSSLICSPDEADVAPSNAGASSVAPLFNMFGTTTTSGVYEGDVRTNSIGKVAARSDLATVDFYTVMTIGFRWGRR